MRELSVSFTSDGKAVLGDALSYQDEHCAVRLAVTLGEDLTGFEPDEYYLSFVRDADAANPMPQKLTAGPVQDIREGVLYYELPSFLTATTCLAVQVEAIKKDQSGEVAAAVKSPPFLIRLQPSLQGEEALPVTHDGNGLLERLINTSEQTIRLNQTLAEALEQGLFLAKINGRNTVTLQGGRNLILTDDEGVLTVDCSSLPIVTSLPQDPRPGETVLLIPQNMVTLRESGRELTTGADLLTAAAASERQMLLLDPSSRCPFYVNLRKAGALVGFLSVTSDYEEGELGEQNTISIFSFITGMRGNLSEEGFEITFVNGAFSSERSSLLRRGNVTELTVIPSSVRLPDYDAIEIVAQGGLQTPAFFCPTALMAYCGQWLEITSLAADKHFHTNRATLEGFFCDASEAAANTPAGQPVLALDYTGWDRLRWGGSEVRMVDDGGVIDRVETVTAGGKSFLRLWMDYGQTQLVQQDGGARPRFIDIPIDSAAAATVSQGGLTLNGTTLDLGVIPPQNADWSENDPSAQGYVQNRTHWRSVEASTETYSFSCLDAEENIWGEDNHKVIRLDASKQYTVNYDGQAYSFTPGQVTVQDSPLLYIGNWNYVVNGEIDPTYTPVSGEIPFLIAYLESENLCGLIAPASLASAGLEFSVTESAEVYHKLSTAYLPEGLTEAIQSAHTHAAETHASSFSGRLKANCLTRVGSSSAPASSVTVTGFDSAGSGAVSEYLLVFHSGSTPVTLTLPDSVVWADELTVEADKVYEISILDDFGLWCAADVEAVNA